MALEINLVPDVKNEMIKALKLRNFIFFLCLIISAASVAAILIFASIAGGQQAAVDGKKKTLDNLSAKINSFEDLGDFLTIKDQLGNLSALADNKKLISRTFDALAAFIPSGPDSIIISGLSIDLANSSVGSAVLDIEAQANAGEAPYIDYNVLDSFKKSMQYMQYDYGDYIDKYGNTIPAYCMIEQDSDGATLYDTEKKSYYAFWLINGDGCNPSKIITAEETEDAEDAEENAEDTSTNTEGYTTEDYNGNTVVRIWRTPRFNDWYKTIPSSDSPYMSLDGTISNVPHFKSRCFSYYGTEEYDGNITWSKTENTCKIVPGGMDGITINSSSNGRDDSNELVLRFSATILIDMEFYDFSNHHLIALAPASRVNVTDSYVQIQNMFGRRAKDCAENDTACKNTTNGGR
ncbi:MAG: hypothetical protein Q4A79_02365 [Candidatus Saccharibacteria bacterium]|nr:hypothetical protein [Candidatus Saccharibacteria bacterium]